MQSGVLKSPNKTINDYFSLLVLFENCNFLTTTKIL